MPEAATRITICFPDDTSARCIPCNADITRIVHIVHLFTMEVCRLGDAVMRRSQPTLVRSICRTSRVRSRQNGLIRQRTARTFVTSLHHNAQSALQEAPTAPSPAPPRDTVSDILDSALDFGKSTPGSSQGRNPRFKTPSAQPDSLASLGPPATNSMGELADAMEPTSPRRRSRPVSNPQVGFENIADLLDADRPSTLSSTYLGPVAPLEKPLPFKLGPSVGRSVRVDSEKGMDVGRAFRQLDIQCSRNSVRKDFTRQRFHERGGLKRKRLRSERWRRRFREGFRGVVGLVARMRKQGW